MFLRLDETGDNKISVKEFKAMLFGKVTVL